MIKADLDTNALSRSRNVRLGCHTDVEEGAGPRLAENLVRSIHVERVEPREEDDEDFVFVCRG